MHNMLAILWLSAGQPARAATALSGYAPGHHQVAPARMLLFLLTGKATEAVSEYSAAVMGPGSNPRTRAALHLLGAVASLRLGSEANALKLLRKATLIYQATGIRIHILLLPQEDRLALQRLAESSGDQDIVEMFALEFPAPLRNLHLPAQLSPREKVVLQQLVHHSSIDDISSALFVSSNTVKSQLRSIYRKLRVSSRDDAIARALEMDLLN
ncbi:LuxR C-terminal-related transcriptional regulator [Arthrobacter psychrolactophilus]